MNQSIQKKILKKILQDLDRRNDRFLIETYGRNPRLTDNKKEPVYRQARKLQRVYE